MQAVVSSATSGTPTGTVTFFSGTATLGTAVISGGQAVLSAASTAVGAVSVTAVYNGDDNFNTATSNTISITTLDADFTIASDATEQAIPILIIKPHMGFPHWHMRYDYFAKFAG